MGELFEQELSGADPLDWLLAASYLVVLFTVGADAVLPEVRQRLDRRRIRYLAVTFVASIPVGFAVGAVVTALLRFLSGLAPEFLVGFWTRYPVAGWVACFVAMDAAGYLYHRIGHETRVGWAGHRPHHLGENYDTTLVARQPWLIVHGLVTFPLVALLGFSLEQIVVCATISLAYQAVQHTSRSWGLGALRHVLVTGHTHRRHHTIEGARGNYGFVLNVWDRALGTWNPELVPSDARYGVGAPEPYSAYEAQFAEWRRLVSAGKRQDSKQPAG